METFKYVSTCFSPRKRDFKIFWIVFSLMDEEDEDDGEKEVEGEMLWERMFFKDKE